MRVDVHTHVVPEEFLDLLRSGKGPSGIRLAERNGKEFVVHDNGLMYPTLPVFSDVRHKLEQMDSDGIDVSILSVSPTLFLYWEDPSETARTCRLVNEGIAALADAGSDRLFAMASIPMNDPQAAATELRRAREELGLVGVEIGTSVGDTMLDAEELAPVFNTAADLGMPVMLHPYVGMLSDPPPSFRGFHLSNVIGNPLETFVAAARLIVGGALDRHPDLLVQLSHGGGAFPYQLGRLEHAYEVRKETRSMAKKNPKSYLGQFLIDTVIFERAALDFLVGLVGADHVVSGTDIPFDMADVPTGDLSRVAQQDVAENVMWRNAARTYGLPIEVG